MPATASTVLVTGAGALGRAVVRLLGAAGRRCIVIDRVSATLTGLPGQVADICDLPQIETVLSEHAPDAVVHTAGMLSAAASAAPVQAVAANVLGTANLLTAAQRSGVRRVVVAGSTSVQYSALARYSGTVPEDFSLHTVAEAPASIYAATKLSAEWIARGFGQAGTPHIVVLRFAPLLGRPGPDGVVSRLLATLARPRDHGPVRIDEPSLVWAGVEEFLDTEDAATAVLAALDAPSPGPVYNIAPGRAVTFAAFLAAAAEARPGLHVAGWPDVSTGLAGFAHPRRAASDISAARRDLQWRPRYSLAQSLARAFAEKVQPNSPRPV